MKVNKINTINYLDEAVEVSVKPYSFLCEEKKYIQSNISKVIKSKGRINMTGEHVYSTRDLANLYTIFRDSRFETFRLILIKNDTIVYTMNVSSKLNTETTIIKHYKNKTDNDGLRMFNEINRKYKDLNCDGYYLFHNHPIENVTMSQDDLHATSVVIKHINGKFLGHVILGINTYNSITPDKNDPSTLHLKTNDIDSNKKLDIEPYKDKHISNITDACNYIETNYKLNNNTTMCVYVNGNFEIQAMQEIDNFEFNDKQIIKYFKNETIKNGAYYVYIITSNEKVFEKTSYYHVIYDNIKSIYVNLKTNLFISDDNYYNLPADVNLKDLQKKKRFNR